MKQFLSAAIFAALILFASSASAFGDTPGLNDGDSAAPSQTTNAASNGNITKFEQRQINNVAAEGTDESTESSLTAELMSQLGLDSTEG